MQVNPQNIDWESDENYFFTNPKQECPIPLERVQLEPLKGHLFVMTSGTQFKKCAALSKKAFLNSAQSVNSHLQIMSQDIWLICLPLFHVGGLSILARSFLSKSQYFILKEKWSPKLFLSSLNRYRATITSLTPTQIYDLTICKLKAPSHLRAVAAGGGVLHESLYKAARKLNWPLLPSYGLTELCSQTAAARLDSLHSNAYPSLQILDHCKVKITKEGCIAVQSNSLLTGWFLKNRDRNMGRVQKSINLLKTSMKKEWVFENPVKNKWFVTEDKGSLKDNGKFLRVLGRDQMVKIRGENVSLMELGNILEKVLIDCSFQGECRILATPHPRTGFQIDLVSTEQNMQNLLQVRQKFNQKVITNEQIQNCYFVYELPKGSLSKVKINLLRRQLGF